MKITKLILTLFICLFSSLLMAAPTHKVLVTKEPKTIRFATEATYPPFEFVDEFGVLKGFDIDLAYALCSQMGANCTFSVQSFNSLIPSLKLGKFDALIGAMGITPERQKEVAFTNSYYEPGASFVAPIAKHYTLANLPGKTIGVQAGTTFEQYLRSKYAHKVKIKTYASVQDAFLDLESGRVDAVLADTPIAQTWLKTTIDSRFTIIDKPIIDHQYFGTGYGIAVRKNDTELLNSLNKALAEIKANGTYKSLVDKYSL